MRSYLLIPKLRRIIGIFLSPTYSFPPTAFTRSPTASPKTNSLSPARPRTRNTLQRSFMNVMKRGVASCTVTALPRHQATRYRCTRYFEFFFSGVTARKSELHTHSRNTTIENSPGYVKTNDPTYASIPADSRKPPAPIDPASPSSSLFLGGTLYSPGFALVSKWFYISSAQV